jgi:glucose/arabinose dehydrogenase
VAALAFAPDGRLFVSEKSGAVWVVKDNARLAAPFIDLADEVLANGDRGLLGIALDPAFADNHHVYLLYTVDPDADGVDDEGVCFGRLARYTASAANPNVADPGSRRVLLGSSWSSGPPSLTSSHAVGCLRFGTDGTLLVGVGDGAHPSGVDAGGRDPVGFTGGRFPASEDLGAFRAQWIGSLAGKILRLDPATGAGLPSNPFYTGNAGDNASRVWAYGLRNPFRFAVRPGTGAARPSDGRPGTLYIGDVGWNTWEEVSVSSGAGGENFGWPCREGFSAGGDYATADSRFGCDSLGTAENPRLPTDPLTATHHFNGSLSRPAGHTGKAVSGFVFYTGTRYPSRFRGACFIAEYNASWIKAARVDAGNKLVELLDFATGVGGPVDLAADPLTGDICCASLTTQEIWRFRQVGANVPPVPTASGTPTSGPAPLAVKFSSDGTSDPDGDRVTLRWDFGDGETSTSGNPSHTYDRPGNYTATLTATDGRGAESTDTVAITVFDGDHRPPLGRIVSPRPLDAFDPEADVLLRAEATDPNEPASGLRFTWNVRLHHNTHVHPDWAVLSGPAASFTPGDHDDGTGTLLEIVLKVTDSEGLSDSKKVFIFPHTRPLVLDEGAPGTSSTGLWQNSRGLAPYGPTSLYSGVSGDTYTWRIAAPPGVHRLYAWWTVLPSRHPEARYTIRHDGGTSVVRVDQRIHGDQWNFLGAYSLDSEVEVTLAAETGYSVAADALCLLKVNGANAPPSAHIHSIAPNPATAGEVVRFEGHGHGEGTIAGYAWTSSRDGFLSDQPVFTTRDLTPGTHSISLRVEDERGAVSAEESAVLEVRGAGAAGEVILDNGAAGTSSSGEWTVSGGAHPYGANSLYSNTPGDRYVFRPALPARGVYEVHAWWTEYESRTTAGPYTITYAVGSAKVLANQRQGGGRWNLLGEFDFAAAAAIALTAAGSGTTTCADAVRLVHRPNDIIIDDGGPGTSATGGWLLSSGEQPYGPRSLYAKNQAAVYRYAFTPLSPGDHEVFAWWTVTASRSAAVRYTIVHAGGQASAVRSQLAGGGRWQSLGRFAFHGPGSVEVAAAADGKSYSADAVLLRKVDG